MVGVVLLLFSIIMCCDAHEPESLVEQKIERLRQKQLTDSYNEYYADEKEIVTLKYDHGSHQSSRYATWHKKCRGILHLMPLIIWQLLAFACAIGLIWLQGRSFFLWLLLIILCGVVWCIGYERTQEWLVISQKEVPIYLGPGVEYPVHAQLKYLEEVSVKQKKDGWLCVQCRETKGWMRNG